MTDDELAACLENIRRAGYLLCHEGSLFDNDKSPHYTTAQEAKDKIVDAFDELLEDARRGWDD